MSATVKMKGKPKAAHLHYSSAVGPWQKRDWKSVLAEIKDGHVMAKLPEERPLVYFLAVTDGRGLEVSTRHEVLVKGEPAKGVR